MHQTPAEALRFLTFLDEAFLSQSEVIAYVQRALGYSITGSVKERFFMLSGEGSNGKSKLLETVAPILGAFAVTVPIAALEGTTNPATLVRS